MVLQEKLPIGMYSSKGPHKWHGANFLTGPYVESGETLDSRFQGKQFLTRPPRAGNAGLPGVLFGRFETAGGKGDTYNTGSTYLRSFPPESRKLGFGTHDAPRRDEFMSGQRAMQHKVTTVKEDVQNRAVLMASCKNKESCYDEKIKLLNQRLEQIHNEYPELDQTRKHPDDFAAHVTKRLFDIGRNDAGITPVLLKNGREQFYSHKRCLQSDKPRHVQSLSTTTGDYGKLCKTVESLSFNKMSDLQRKNNAAPSSALGHIKLGQDED